MRIISGTLRSRRINPPKNLPVRPTTDMAKEALFNILQNQIDFTEMSVLDMFAGTGSISYEFCSRECQSVVSVEQNPNCIRFIKGTKEQFGLDQLEVIQANCFDFLKRAWKKYDIIFADPPYDMPNFEELVQMVFDKELLSEGGMLIVEHSKKTDLSNFPNYRNTRKYGSVNFSFFE